MLSVVQYQFELNKNRRTFNYIVLKKVKTYARIKYLFNLSYATEFVEKKITIFKSLKLMAIAQTKFSKSLCSSPYLTHS